MITNDRQYKIVKSQIERFQQSLDDLSVKAKKIKDIHPKILEASRQAIVSQLKQLIDMVSEYESLKSGQIVATEITSLQELYVALIKARIANGLTQAELAEKLGLKMQQIQRYESERYETASLKTLERIAEQLNIRLNADVQLRPISAPDEFNVSKYPFKEMFNRNWFSDFVGDFNTALKNSSELIKNFFESAHIDALTLKLNRQSFRVGNELNSFAIKAWYARVLIKAQTQTDLPPFSTALITDNWLLGLVQLSDLSDGLNKISNYINSIGIKLVIEAQLPGTRLDGAALLVKDQPPIIAMTLRYDRLDNFWFVLFHELAHIRLHLNEQSPMIFDDLDVDAKGIEQEADKFALNLLIPDAVWRKSLVRFSPSDETIRNQAAELKINPALVAGRIRKETGKYHLFGNLIGAGEVRKKFEKELYD
jgi:HTH-type transcriptional regulator/antitoxin HigA